jgi:hypothetical protein
MTSSICVEQMTRKFGFRKALEHCHHETSVAPTFRRTVSLENRMHLALGRHDTPVVQSARWESTTRVSWLLTFGHMRLAAATGWRYGLARNHKPP